MEQLSLPEGYQARKVRNKKALVIVKIVAPAMKTKEKREMVVGRPTIERGVFSGRVRPGDLVWDGTGEQKRILTCLTCDYVPEDEDFIGGYVAQLGNPTAEEQDTDDYRKMVADLEQERRREAAREAEAEARRQAYREEYIEANGEEPNWLDEFFAGTSDN